MVISDLESAVIADRLRELLGTERGVQADFLLHLAEFDRRRGWEISGQPNLWEYCRRELGLLECATFRRIHAARLIQRFPQAIDYLRDGRLWMTTLVMLEDVLTEANSVDVLKQASNKSKKEVEYLVACLRAPEKSPQTTIRKLPERRIPEESATPVPAQVKVMAEAAAAGEINREISAEDSKQLISDRSDPIPQTRAERTADVRPISRDEYVVKMTVSREFLEALERAKEISSHAIPDGDIVAVLRRGLEQIIAKREKRGSRAVKARREGEPAPAIETQRDRAREPGNAIAARRTENADADRVACSTERKGAADGQERVAAAGDGAKPAASHERRERAGREPVPERVRREVFDRDALLFVGDGRWPAVRITMEVGAGSPRAGGVGREIHGGESAGGVPGSQPAVRAGEVSGFSREKCACVSGYHARHEGFGDRGDGAYRWVCDAQAPGGGGFGDGAGEKARGDRGEA